MGMLMACSVLIYIIFHLDEVSKKVVVLVMLDRYSLLAQVQ